MAKKNTTFKNYQFSTDKIMSYSAKPEFGWKLNPNNIYMGLEIEVDNLPLDRDDDYCEDCDTHDCDCSWRSEEQSESYPVNLIANSLATNLKGEHIIKHDGSLNNGIEIVTSPIDTNSLASYRKQFENILNTCKQAGSTAHNSNTCGLHVHFSRANLSVAENKLLEKSLRSFIVNQKLFWLALSRRKNLGYCKIPKTSSESAFNDKFRAINFQHSNTIEFRIIRGTLNFKRFWSTICFLKAIYTYSFNEAKKGNSVKHEDYFNLIERLEQAGKLNDLLYNRKHYSYRYATVSHLQHTYNLTGAEVYAIKQYFDEYGLTKFKWKAKPKDIRAEDAFNHYLSMAKMLAPKNKEVLKLESQQLGFNQ